MAEAAAPSSAPSTPATAGGTDASVSSAPVTGAASASGAEEFEEFVIKGETKRVPRSQLKSWAQKGFAADEGFRTLAAEKAALAKEKQAIAAEDEMWKTDPKKAVRMRAQRTGVDLAVVARQLVLENADEQQLSPDARKLREAEEKLAAIEREKTEREETEKSAKLQAARDTQAKGLVATWSKALQAKGLVAGTTDAAWAIKRMISLERANLAHAEAAGLPPLGPDDLAAQLDDDLLAEQKQIFAPGGKVTDGKAFLSRMDRIDPDAWKVIGREIAERIKTANAPKTPAPITPSAPAGGVGRAPDGKFVPKAPSREDQLWERFTKGKK